MFTLLLMALIGLVFFIIGWLLWKRQRITLIHSYHYPFVKAEDRPAYTAQMGKACLLIGAGCLLCGLINCFTGTAWGWAAFAACFLAGCLMMLSAQRKYNRPGGTA